MFFLWTISRVEEQGVKEQGGAAGGCSAVETAHTSNPAGAEGGKMMRGRSRYLSESEHGAGGHCVRDRDTLCHAGFSVLSE